MAKKTSHKASNKSQGHTYTGKHQHVSGLPTNHHPHRTRLSHPDMNPQAQMGKPQLGTPGQVQPNNNGDSIM